MTTYKHFQVEHSGDVTVARLKNSELIERLDSGEFHDELISFVAEHQPAKLLISFEYVKRFSSETINALLRAREYILSENAQLKLCEMRDEIREAFAVLNLDGRVFEIHDSVNRAVDSFD